MNAWLAYFIDLFICYLSILKAIVGIEFIRRKKLGQLENSKRSFKRTSVAVLQLLDLDHDRYNNDGFYNDGLVYEVV